MKRNLNRFPEDFIFQLSQEEAQSLRFQIGMSKPGGGRGGRRYLPYAFTEHGVAMLSSVLNSERAVAMNILIIRAFVRLREILATNKDLARKIEELELRQEVQASHIANIYQIVKGLCRARASQAPPDWISRPMPTSRRKGLRGEVAASSPSSWRGQA